MAGGTETVPSNDSSNEPWSQKKISGWRKSTSRQVRGEVRLDRADVVIDGMYGPPQSCKRKTKNGSWSAPMYSALSGVRDSGHDGYPLALVPIMWTVW